MLFFTPLSPLKELKAILSATRCKKGGFLPLSTFNGVYAKNLKEYNRRYQVVLLEYERVNLPLFLFLRSFP